MILVAGPYRSGTDGDPARILANVDAMTAISLELYRRGHLPERVGDGDDPFEEIFHPIAERVLAHSDGCLRIGGPSERGGPAGRDRPTASQTVYHDMGEIP